MARMIDAERCSYGSARGCIPLHTITQSSREQTVINVVICRVLYLACRHMADFGRFTPLKCRAFADKRQKAEICQITTHPT